MNLSRLASLRRMGGISSILKAFWLGRKVPAREPIAEKRLGGMLGIFGMPLLPREEIKLSSPPIPLA